MNKKVYLLAAVLSLCSVALIIAKVFYGGTTVNRDFSRNLWRIHIVMNAVGQGARSKVRLTLPKDTPRQTIYNEHFENGNMVFYVRERPITGNRVGFWRSELFDGSQSLQYIFSAQLKNLDYKIPPQLKIPGNPVEFFGPDMKIWLEPSKFIQSEDAAMKRYLKKTVGKERRTAVVVRKIFDFVRGEVKYRSEKGSKDAKETLNKLVADCGGQARLFAALSRSAGIPSRTVGGLIITGGVKNTTHVWVENYIGGQWIPFDVVNNHFATMPSDYLELYRGDYYLIKHVGLSRFEYFFVIEPERMPPIDQPWSLYVLPIHFQTYVMILLLIPVGALLVALFRSVIGVPTFGTFTPILLGLAFREVSLGIGLWCLASVILMGWLLRRLLDYFKILVIPRIAIILTMVVIFILILIVAGFHLGFHKILFVSFFPMIIMTWTVERFSVMQIEDGTASAMKSAAGTILISLVAYAVFGAQMLRTYLFAFPELLLVVMSLLLILGRYTGLRVTEFWRFKEFMKLKHTQSAPPAK